MRTSITGALAPLAPLALLAASAPVFAQASPTDAPSAITVTGGVTLANDYRFRGVSLTDRDATIQGTITVNHESGFYVGTWASNLADTPTYGNIEIDLYGGWTREVAPGTSVDVGALYYFYPSSHTGHGEFIEPYASVRHTLGPATAKLGIAYAPSQGAIGDKDNVYVYGELGSSIPRTPVTVTGHLGYSDGSLAFVGHYWDWSLGADVALGHNLTAGIKYVDTDLPSTGIHAIDRLSDAGVVVTLGASF